MSTKNIPKFPTPEHERLIAALGEALNELPAYRQQELQRTLQTESDCSADAPELQRDE